MPRRHDLRLPLAAATLLGGLLGGLAHAGAAGSSCQVQSAAVVPTVVELYTSEGCSSCPPADRWLSHWSDAPASVVLAFHVDYWDRLGWPDRFASPRYTQRQAQQQRSSGARFSYTPQVLVDGVDRPDWPALNARRSADARPGARVEVRLERDDQHVRAQVRALPGAPDRLAAYWAVTEQDHASSVRAGENAGATLHHDFVVRDYETVAPWRTGAPGQTITLPFELHGQPDPGHPRSVNLVVVDAETGRPVQAVRLGC